MLTKGVKSSGFSTGGTLEDIIEEWHHEWMHTNLADAIRVCQTGTRGPRWRRPARGPLGEGHDGLQQTSSDLQEGRRKDNRRQRKGSAAMQNVPH